MVIFTIFVTMKKSIFIVGSVWMALSCCMPVRAQEQPELQAFQEAAGDRSILFRGKQADRYTLLANGNPYWENAEYKRGDIVFEDNAYYDVLVNIDAYRQRALVRMSGSPMAVSLAPAQTPSITAGGRHFVGIGPGEALPEGFYEVFGSGPEHVYKHIEKRLNSSTSYVNGSTIGYLDDNYRNDVTRYFALLKSYYFQDAQGNFSRFKGRGALIRKFPDRKKKIRQALAGSRLDSSETSFDAFCEAVLNIAAQ